VPNNLQTATTISASELERARLENKMRELFEDELKKLSEDLRDVLAEDIVTAFLNRLGLFIEIETKKKMYTHTKPGLNP
jgi:hypothetical protein